MVTENELMPQDGEDEDKKIDQELTADDLESLGAIYKLVNNEAGLVIEDGPLEGDDVLLKEMFDPNYAGPITDEHTMAWERSDAHKESLIEEEEASVTYNQAMSMVGLRNEPANDLGLKRVKELIKADKEATELLQKMTGKDETL